MRDHRLTINGILAVLIVFSAIGLFATVSSLRMSDPSVVNETYPIEGTPYSIRYSTFEESGIVKGKGADNELLLPGTYGTDWGVAAEGDFLYVNKYHSTTVGLLISDVTRVDTTTWQEEILYEDAVLRGRCKSGELVVVTGAMLPANRPAKNSLCRFYSMSAKGIRPDGKKARILYLDPATGEALLTLEGEAAFRKDFESRYLDKTLEEVRSCE